MGYAPAVVLYRSVPVDRACTRGSSGVQIMLWGGLWLVQAPCVPHGLGTQKGGVEHAQIRN